MRLIIAIDGYSSCGKSTVAKEVARELKYIYIDSGAMYRAVTLYCLRNNLIHNDLVDIKQLEEHINRIQIRFRPNPLTGKNDTWLNGENVEDEIRTPAVADMVSPVSVIGYVREAMVRLQREMGKEKGIVMDGRDIGTVVFPEAELKIFMTASPEIRARRRYDELKAKGLDVSLEEIIKNITDRDRIDSTREISPLRQAEDALVLDNSHLTREEQLVWVLEKVAQLKNRDA
jgi:cytidylate kinase